MTNHTTYSVRFNDIVCGRNANDVLLVIWNTAPFLNALYEVGIREYYFDPEIKLDVQLKFCNQFPEIMCLPGIWADFGALCEPSAFGCEIFWPEGGGMPTAKPLRLSEQEFFMLKPIDPDKDGLMPVAFEQYRYFWENLDHRYIDEFGYLDGVAASFGPLELVAVLVGHANFFMLLMTNPKLIHYLTQITTESIIRFLRAHEQINGPLKRIAIADHIPGQISLDHFEEFFLPCTNEVLEVFPDAMVLYHNEYPIPYPEALSNLKTDIFHFGGSISRLKNAVGDRMSLMGNLPPVEVLAKGTEKDVFEESKKALAKGTTGGRFLLSSGGGLAPETPAENIVAMENALLDYLSQQKAV
jgi:uroporphyrinogen decarboxylase